MAKFQLLWASAGVIVLLCGGCHSLLPACGQAPKNTRIVGGQNASPGSWPWFASIKTDGRPFCGGSLITNQWVLTAAHCLGSRDDLLTTMVSLGSQSQTVINFNEVRTTLESIVCHPSFEFLTNDNDICLLKLSSPVNFTDYIYPVCLASAGSTFHTGVNSWVTGFGSTDPSSPFGVEILQEVNVPIVGNNECRCAYPQITDNVICAGLREGGKDACQGDSGGPMVTKDGSIWVQSGIVSFGEGCARPNTPGGYARVSQYQEWISNVTGTSRPGFVTYTSPGVDSDLNLNCSDVRLTTKPTPTTAQPVTEGPTPDGSVFSSGESMIHFSHFSPLGLLLVSLYVLVRQV
ncbi:serine protease 27-like [Pungitius pungitius]|uniref:serine protease 27-like n=1 Tax=Pungitius pungitius TaxID=134920 RepID=UPI002E0DAF4A